MALTHAVISGKILNPASGPMRVRVTISAVAASGTVKSETENVVIAGEVSVESSSTGDLSVALPLLPQAGVTPAEARWRARFDLLDYKNVRGAGRPSDPTTIEFELTGNTTWADLVDVSGVPITETLLVQANAARDAAQTAAADAEAAKVAAQAVGTTNDTVIAGRINDQASATVAALAAQTEAKALAVREVSRVTTKPGGTDTPVITFSTSTTIASSVAVRERREGGVTGAPLDMASDPSFRYVGFPSGTPWPAAVNFYTFTPIMPGGDAQARRWDFQAEMDYDGSQIEFIFYSPSAGAAPFYFLVDGRRTNLTTTPSGLGAVDTYTKLTFPDARKRRIRVVAPGALPWQGARIQPGTTLTRPTDATGRKVAVIADSIGAGSNTSDSSETAAYTIGYALGADVVINASIGGTKWVPSGSGDVAVSHFGGGRLTSVLAMNPDAVVFYGSRNDTGSTAPQLAAIQTAVEDALTAVAAVPEVYVVGTITDLPQNEPVKAGTLAKSRPFIDVHDAITGTGQISAPTGTGNADIYIGDVGVNDSVHPSYAGHRYLERLILSRLIALNPDPWRVDRYQDIGAAFRARSGVGAVLGSDALPDSPGFLQVDPKVGLGTPTAFSNASVGNWNVSVNASCIGNGFVFNPTVALENSLAYDLVLGAGTWVFTVMYVKDAAGAIVTVELQALDGSWVSLGTIDHYAAAAAHNQLVSFTPVAVTGAARRRRLRLRVTGKNASSSNYSARFQLIQAHRTA